VLEDDNNLNNSPTSYHYTVLFEGKICRRVQGLYQVVVVCPQANLALSIKHKGWNLRE